MTNNFTLADIRAAADKKYGNISLTLSDGFEVQLVNALRLSKEKRKALGEVSDRLGEDGVDQAEVFEDALRIVANTEVGGAKLIEEIGGDLAVLAETFESYTGSTELGEASASES